MQYADGLLANIQAIITGSVGESRQKFDEMFSALQTVFNECEVNRSQLQGSMSYEDEAETEETN